MALSPFPSHVSVELPRAVRKMEGAALDVRLQQPWDSSQIPAELLDAVKTIKLETKERQADLTTYVPSCVIINGLYTDAEGVKRKLPVRHPVIMPTTTSECYFCDGKRLYHVGSLANHWRDKHKQAYDRLIAEHEETVQLHRQWLAYQDPKKRVADDHENEAAKKRRSKKNEKVLEVEGFYERVEGDEDIKASVIDMKGMSAEEKEFLHDKLIKFRQKKGSTGALGRDGEDEVNEDKDLGDEESIPASSGDADASSDKTNHKQQEDNHSKETTGISRHDVEQQSPATFFSPDVMSQGGTVGESIISGKAAQVRSEIDAPPTRKGTIITDDGKLTPRVGHPFAAAMKISGATSAPTTTKASDGAESGASDSATAAAEGCGGAINTSADFPDSADEEEDVKSPAAMRGNATPAKETHRIDEDDREKCSGDGSNVKKQKSTDIEPDNAVDSENFENMKSQKAVGDSQKARSEQMNKMVPALTSSRAVASATAFSVNSATSRQNRTVAYSLALSNMWLKAVKSSLIQSIEAEGQALRLYRIIKSNAEDPGLLGDVAAFLESRKIRSRPTDEDETLVAALANFLTQVNLPQL